MKKGKYIKYNEEGKPILNKKVDWFITWGEEDPKEHVLSISLNGIKELKEDNHEIQIPIYELGEYIFKDLKKWTVKQKKWTDKYG
ncbi:MAG TPA: hypothetical protein ENH95_02915 [Nitrosopumilus sp.]|nr:hypothetical protein [Nitrosopumilus sp.]